MPIKKRRITGRKAQPMVPKPRQWRSSAPAYKPSKCPNCGAVAYSLEEEMSHMEVRHPEIVAARLAAAERESQVSSSWDDD